MSTFFAVDLGNTRAAIGIAGADGLRDVLRLSTSNLADLTEGLTLVASKAGMDEVPVVATSVNPSALEELRRLAKTFSSAAVLVAGDDFPVPIEADVAEPAKVGTDRLLAALAARRRSKGPCIVLDFGTATTVDAVSAEGVFLGGVIVPGMDLMARSLSAGTAALPEVQVEKPDKLLGRDTAGAISSGIYFGYLGLVEGLVERFRQRMGPEASVWATGGAAKKITGDLGLFDYLEPDLVLEGLVMSYREFLER